MIFASLPQIILAAATEAAQECGNQTKAIICSGSSTGIPGGNGDIGLAVGKIMSAIFGVMGSLAVIMVIVGGLQYVLSSGDPKRTARAKETILYAAIGVVISISAYAIVTFISSSLSK